MSPYRVSIDREALEDIQQAIDWYDKRLIGLGAEFQSQVCFQINQLKDFPKIHRLRYSDIRCSLVKRFPFLIHYAVDERTNLVEVIAVFHTSRNPKNLGRESQ